MIGYLSDGSTSSGTGMDGNGHFLSSNLLGASPLTTSAGTQFSIGSAGVNDVVQCAGQTIVLPRSSWAAIKLLATGKFSHVE